MLTVLKITTNIIICTNSFHQLKFASSSSHLHTLSIYICWHNRCWCSSLSINLNSCYLLVIFCNGLILNCDGYSKVFEDDENDRMIGRQIFMLYGGKVIGVVITVILYTHFWTSSFKHHNTRKLGWPYR